MLNMYPFLNQYNNKNSTLSINKYTWIIMIYKLLSIIVVNTIKFKNVICVWGLWYWILLNPHYNKSAVRNNHQFQLNNHQRLTWEKSNKTATNHYWIGHKGHFASPLFLTNVFVSLHIIVTVKIPALLRWVLTFCCFVYQIYYITAYLFAKS